MLRYSVAGILVVAQLAFMRHANKHLMRMQVIDITKDFQFPGRYLDGSCPVLGVFLDLSCNKSEYILNMASGNELFNAKYDWLVVDDNQWPTKVAAQFEKTMMSIDAQLTYALPLVKRTPRPTEISFITYDIYNNGKFLGGKLNTTLSKNVTCNSTACRTKYLTDLHLKSKYGNRCNLNDTTFRISVVVTGIPINTTDEELLRFLASKGDFHLDPISRYGYNLLLIIQTMMNFRHKYIFRPAWSVTETSGASLGDLSKGSAELSSSPFIPTLSRINVVSPVLNIGQFRSIFLFRTPRNEGLYGEVFLNPFSPPLWIAFIVVITGFAFVFWAIFVVESCVVKYIRFIPSLLSTFLISFGLACVQSSALIPRTTGGRMAFFALCVVTFIMYNYYTSAVVSSLVGSPIKSNIRNIGQLADSSLDIGIEDVPYTRAYLRSATYPDVKKFMRKKLEGRLSVNSSLWLKANEGILRVKKGGFAYHSEAATAYLLVEKYFEQHELCELNEVSLRKETGLAIMMGKKSPYKEIIRLSFIRMQETGVLSKHRRQWLKEKMHCFANSVLIKVGLEYTGPLFVLLGTVYIFAFIVLVLEITIHKYILKWNESHYS